MAFLNARWTEQDPSTTEPSAPWAAAGQPLANHGFGHRHLSEMSAAGVRAGTCEERAAAQAISRAARTGSGSAIRSSTKAERARRSATRLGQSLPGTATRLRPSPWTSATGPGPRLMPAARTRATRRRSPGLSRCTCRRRAKASPTIENYRKATYGRDIPYVLLLHVSAFEGRMMPRLLKLYRDEGFRFVTLAQAQADPAYLDQMEPGRPAEPQGLEDKARERVDQCPQGPTTSRSLRRCAKPSARPPSASRS